MGSIALYSKYRPSNFDEIYGQSAVVQTLRNQVISGKISHAYLFQGLRGSGKTSIARILSRAINCDNPVNGNPCGQCPHCNYKNNVNPDLIEMDAASNNSIDNIRQLVDEVKYKPTNSKYKIYIIDEVHMLSNSSFNVLLKTLEEPPEHAVFILCTTELHKVPATIKSRCQIFGFKVIPKDKIKKALSDILKNENCVCLDNDEILEYIAKKSEGSMRDALSLLEQCIGMYINETRDKVPLEEILTVFGDVEIEIIQSMNNALLNMNVMEALDILHNQYYNGVDLKTFFKALYDYYFNNFVLHFQQDVTSESERYMTIMGEMISKIDHNNAASLATAEIAIVKCCKPDKEYNYNAIVQRMNNIEQRMRNVQYQVPKQLQQTSIQNNISNNKIIDANSIVSYYNVRCQHEIRIV